jgi:hypothetical protein
LTLDKLPLGRYVVRVVEPGYRVERADFALTATKVAHSINVRLSPERGASGGSRGTAPAVRGAAPSARPVPQAPASAENTFTGTLFVDSRPQGANVLLDGRVVGKTPLRIADVRIGTHVVRLELPEHRPFSSIARITAGKEERVTGSLERFQ